MSGGAPTTHGGLDWYWRRLRRMSPGEVALRVRDEARRRLWQRRQVRPGTVGAGEPASAPRTRPPRFQSRLPAGAAAMVPDGARRALLTAAEGLLEGRWEVLGVDRDDLAAPDWFLDPLSGRHAPRDRYCFGVDHRSEAETGNVKQVWEVSRHQHLTVLAASWYLSGDDRFAVVVDRQLRDWWRKNPFLSGVHWTSGIELGLRLVAWTWIRRLLDGWEGAAPLFEDNPEARRQIRWHQEYLAAFRSAGSSANNHVIAEAAGQLVASCAFDWFPESSGWRTDAAALLERELDRNTFPSGLNRELASDYHCFVAELGLVAAVEADTARHPLGEATWSRLCRMLDSAAAVVDERSRPPRQGDGDDGRGLLVDAPAANPWPALLGTGAAIFGAMPWWPDAPADVRSTLLAALAGPRTPQGHRPGRRPSHFADAGLTILRTSTGGPEIWCRCDAGPHGYLAIAAHAHADALSVEVRCGGVDVLADPGTFCYHGDPQWRAYFRSTVGHNTLELGGCDQSESGGPFLWAAHAPSRLTGLALDGDLQHWSAAHDGYARLDPPAVHHRAVHLDGDRRTLEIVDRVDGGRHTCRLALHLGPAIEATLDGHVARLGWPAADGPASARVRLPTQLRWTAHRGEMTPILGWYSAGFGRKEPATTLLGTGRHPSVGENLVTLVEFRE